MGIRERIAEWRNRPSRTDLAATVATLSRELENKRFKRFNPVASGVPITYHQFEYEHNEEMKGAGRWDLLDRMALDPHIKGSLRAIMLPMMKADWEIEPASDSKRDQEIAEFVSANLLRKGGDKYGAEFYLQTPWKAQRLREILDMLESGFAMFAKSTKIVKGKRVYDRLQWLEPSSVDPRGWHLSETDKIEHIERTYSTPGDRYLFEEPMTAHQVVLYPWDVKGARYEGRPMTRPMYGPWMRKEYKQKMSAILTQKLGAPMPYGWYPKGFPQAAIPAFVRAVEAMRGANAAEAYVAGPMGDDGKPPELGYAGASHNIERGFTDSISAENREIRHAAGQAAANLGESQSGSRSLGDTKGLTEMDLVEAVAEVVCEFETHGVANLRGPIEELVDWNFPNVKAYPKLAVNRLNPFAIQMSWKQLVDAWNSGVVPRTPEARRQIVETHLGLNLPDEQYSEEIPPSLVPGAPQTNTSSDGSPPAVASGTGDQGSPPAKEEEEEEKEKPKMKVAAEAAMRDRFKELLEPAEDAPAGGRFRGRTVLESRVCDLAAVSETFRVGEEQFVTALRKTHRAMIEDLQGRLRAGKINARNIESQRRSNYSGAKGARAAIVAVFGEVGEQGAAHVAREIKKQEDRDAS